MYGKLSIFQACEVIQRHVTHAQVMCLGRLGLQLVWHMMQTLREFSNMSYGVFGAERVKIHFAIFYLVS